MRIRRVAGLAWTKSAFDESWHRNGAGKGTSGVEEGDWLIAEVYTTSSWIAVHGPCFPSPALTPAPKIKQSAQNLTV